MLNLRARKAKSAKQHEYIVSKLYSKGGKEHIPYQDSNLTRILETSLGGKARTAILCTMSPARSHVEQSKNTLEFAKDVTTHARVNVIVSDKALVKHLREEVARLENEMRSGPSKFAPRNFSALLKEKDSQIEKVTFCKRRITKVVELSLKITFPCSWRRRLKN